MAHNPNREAAGGLDGMDVVGSVYAIEDAERKLDALLMEDDAK